MGLLDFWRIVSPFRTADKLFPISIGSFTASIDDEPRAVAEKSPRTIPPFPGVPSIPKFPGFPLSRPAASKNFVFLLTKGVPILYIYTLVRKR